MVGTCLPGDGTQQWWPFSTYRGVRIGPPGMSNEKRPCGCCLDGGPAPLRKPKRPQMITQGWQACLKLAERSFLYFSSGTPKCHPAALFGFTLPILSPCYS